MAGYSTSPIDLTLEDDGPGATANGPYSRFESVPLSQPLRRARTKPTTNAIPSFGPGPGMSMNPLDQPYTYQDPSPLDLPPLPFFVDGAYPPSLPWRQPVQQPVNPMHPTPRPLNLQQNPPEPPPYEPSDLYAPTPRVYLSPKTPVCIGQLAVSALILYPVNYLNPGDEQVIGSGREWAPVALNYEHNPSRTSGQDIIHITTPTSRGTMGESLGGETFGMVEHRIASTVGPMLGKGLIMLEAKVRKGPPGVSSYKWLPASGH